MAELLLHIALVDLGRGGEAGAQRMAGEFPLPFGFGKVGADAGGKRGALDQAGDMLVGEPVGADLAAPAMRRNSGPWAMRAN